MQGHVEARHQPAILHTVDISTVAALGHFTVYHAVANGCVCAEQGISAQASFEEPNNRNSFSD
eukprot:6696147-Lingulodinium_polyedra.AAC.2